MSVQSLTVDIGGNLSGFERVIAQANGLLARFTAQAGQAGNNFDSGFGASVTRTTQKVGLNIEGLKLRLDALTTKRDLSIDTATITSANREIADLQGRIRQLQGLGSPVPEIPSSAGSGLLSYAAGLFSIGAAFSAAKAGIGIIADVNRLDLRLQAVSTSAADFAQEQAFLQRSSDRLGLSYQTLAGSYVGLKASAEGTNLAGAKTDAIFEAIIRRGAKLGLSNEDVTGSLRAVGQMMSKGTVQAEELRGQLGDRLPGAFDAMARALGVTTAELGKMLKEGNVLAEDALPKLAAELEKTAVGAERNATTIAGGTNRMANEFRLLIAEFGKTAGIDTFFAKITGGLAEFARGARQLNKDKPTDFFSFSVAPGLRQSNAEAASKSRQLEKFAGYSPQKRRANIDILQSDIAEGEASLKKQTGNRPAITPDERALQGDLDRKRQLVREMQRENLKLLVAERAASTNAAQTTPKTDPNEALLRSLDKLEKRQDELTKKRRAILAQGGTFGGKDAAELADITRRLDRSKPPKKEAKGIQAKDTYLSDVDTLTKNLAESQKRIVDAALTGKVIPPAEIERVKGLTNELKRAADLKDHLLKLNDPSLLKNIDLLAIRGGSVAKGADRRLKSIDPVPTRLLGVNKVLPGIDADKITAEAKELLRLKEFSKDGFTTKNNTLIDQLAAQVGGKDELQRLYNEIKNDGKTIEQALDEAFSISAGKKDKLASGASSVLQSIGEAMGKGENPLKAGLQGILDILGSYLIELGTALLLSSQALLAAAPLTFGITLAPGIGQQLAGAGLIVGGAAVKAIGATAFANGGLVYGPTLSYTGEYAGARSNPEVIAPLSKLRGILAEGQSANGGPLNVQVSGVVRGNDQYITGRRTEREKARYWG